MANKDFERMIKLGEWLEEYLEPDISKWTLLKLFKDGAKLIGVEEKLSSDCEVCKLLKEKNALTVSMSPHTNYLANVMGCGPRVQKVLREIYKHKMPWEQILLEFEKDLALYGFTVGLRLSYAELRNMIKKKDGEYRLTKTLSGVNLIKKIDKYMSQLKDSNNQKADFKVNEIDEDPTFELIQKKIDGGLQRNYLIIVARIFFDFLILGGQEYFLFCEQCDRFTVIRRKGRKKFCSDICRTNYGREKNPAK